MQEVADSVQRFFCDERYVPAFATRPDKQAMGFLIGGFSAGARKSELWFPAAVVALIAAFSWWLACYAVVFFLLLAG